jgi:hypothetical protein
VTGLDSGDAMTDQVAFDEMITPLDQGLALADPDSPRARVFASLQRSAERRRLVLQMSAPGARPIRLIAVMVEMRDLVRREQHWIGEIVMAGVVSPEQLDLLQFYKGHLVRVEIASGMAIASVARWK